MKENKEEEYKLFAKQIRELTLRIIYEAKSSHIGGAFSMTELLAVLYTDILNVSPASQTDPNRDRFILSKGHCCASLYSALALKGFFTTQQLIDSYGVDGTQFFTHVSHYLPGIEISSGSLGHGLSIASGMALAAKKMEKSYRTYCLVGDGELDEGSNWEAILFAAHCKLDNLCLIVDYNKIQSMGDTNKILNLEPLTNKFIAFNWNVIEVDGHNFSEIKTAFDNAQTMNTAPTVIIANTIKGKGVSFMEGDLLWHYKSPDKNQFELAMGELQK